MGSRLHLFFGEILKYYMGGHSDSRSILEGEYVLNVGLVAVVGYKTKKE
jgi:hypothetical protein